MYGVAGAAYVYLVYGMYHCLNVVTEPPGHPAAVLIRAVEPVVGIAAMREARAAVAARRGRTLRRVADARIASGPGLVGEAFELTVADTGRDLCDAGGALRLELVAARPAPVRVVSGPRVGIDYAAEPWRSKPWRLVDAASPSVSGRPRR